MTASVCNFIVSPPNKNERELQEPTAGVTTPEFVMSRLVSGANEGTQPNFHVAAARFPGVSDPGLATA
jgi:hypothetical protein